MTAPGQLTIFGLLPPAPSVWAQLGEWMVGERDALPWAAAGAVAGVEAKAGADIGSEVTRAVAASTAPGRVRAKGERAEGCRWLDGSRCSGLDGRAGEGWSRVGEYVMKGGGCGEGCPGFVTGKARRVAGGGKSKVKGKQ